MSHQRDVRTTSSVADAYRSMYAKPNEDILEEELINALIEDTREEEINEWLEYIQEDGLMSYPKKNEKKIRPMLMKIAKKHPRVKVSFGTHSKGKFVDDNNINFKGKDKDVDALLKDIQNNHKNLVKMMEGNELEEGALADKAKKSGISVGTLRKVYNRGMAAWKTGHRPGTTPQQWGMARVNAFIVKKKKGKLNHDQDLAHIIHPDDSMLDEAMKLAQIVRKHKSALMKAKRTGNLELPSKVEKDLQQWVFDNEPNIGDDPDEFDQWLDDNLDDLVPTLKIKEETELTEAMSKQMTVQQYANKIGIDAKEKQWIIDNEPDIVVFLPNDKLKGWSALSYPIRNNDYYFAFLTGDDAKRRTAASRANMMMNNYLKSELAKAKKLKFDDEPYTEDMIASYLWNVMSKEFEKLPANLGAGDTMVREELYKAIFDITNGGEVQFESYEYHIPTIKEGMLSGIVGKIVNKIRSARKKVGKRIKLGKKAVIKASVGSYGGAMNPMGEQVEGALHLLEKAYDQNDVKKVRVLERKLQNMLKEVDKTMRGSGLSAPAFSMVRGGIVKGLESIKKFYKIANSGKNESAITRSVAETYALMQKQDISEVSQQAKIAKAIDIASSMAGNMTGAVKRIEAIKKGLSKNKNVAKALRLANEEVISEETQLDEVQKVEVDSMRKVSKQMQSVLKSYQAIANKGDKELKDTRHNATYKKVLDARDSVLKMIGTLQTKMIMQQKESLEERVSGDDTPMSMMVHSKDLDVFKKLKVMASKAGVKLAKELKGIKVTGPVRSLIAFVELMDKEPSFKKESVQELGEVVNYHTMISGMRIVAAMKKNPVLKKYAIQIPVGKKLNTYDVADILARQMRRFGFKNKELKAIEDVMQNAYGGQLKAGLNLGGAIARGVMSVATSGAAAAAQGSQSEELNDKDKKKVKEIIKKLKGASKAHAGQAKDLEKSLNDEKIKEGKVFVHTKDPKVFTALQKIAKQTGAKVKKKSGGVEVMGKDLDKGKGFLYQLDKVDIPGFNPNYESVNEKVKDGKLDPLSPMGKSKLTGREISNYFKNNPKQKMAARDKSVKKAIELALDLSGNMNYAMREIEKFKKGLSKNPAVKLALRHANESTEYKGHHVVIENLSPANVVKLKTFGKMMAKMTKLPFDENNPEKSIDKLMGQVWKQKHVPANWERLHKMVAMLRDIGVKMPSLKGKYMGLDPVTKKAIFYKEGTDEIVEWYEQINENKDVRKKYRGKEQKSVDKLIMQKGVDKVQKHHDRNPKEFDKMVKNLAMMEDVQEGIEDLVERPNKELPVADVKKIAQMTNRNDHNGALLHLAKKVGMKTHIDGLKHIIGLHKSLGHMPKGLMDIRKHISDSLMRVAKEFYTNYDDIYKSF